MRFRHTARAAALAAALLLAIPIAVRAEEVVRAGFGSLEIGGLAQAAWIYHLGEDEPGYTLQPDNTLADRVATDIPDENEFLLQRVRLRLSGEVVSEKVRYVVQAELAGENASLLDARISLGYLPYTWLHIGRWAPPVTLLSAVEPEDILLIDYPLMDADPTGRALHTFRDLGVGADVSFPYGTLHIGVFNGQDAPFSDGDNNSAKDFFAGVIIKPPVRGLRFHAAFRQSFAFDVAVSDVDSDNEFKEQNDGAQDFTGGLWFVPRYGPIVAGAIAYRIATAAESDQDERSLLTWYAMAGFDLWYLTGLPVQLIGRYDSMDPNVDHRAQRYEVITAGFNYSFEGPHARVALNYLHRIEHYDVTGKDGSIQTGFDDDVLKLQVQVAF